MRALVAQSLMIALFVVITSNAEAQLSKLMSKLPTKRANGSNAVRTPLPPKQFRVPAVRPAQFEEILPAPAAEVEVFSDMGQIEQPMGGGVLSGQMIGGQVAGDPVLGDTLVGDSMGGIGYDAPPAPPNDVVVSDLLPPSESPAVEYGQSPIYSEPAPGEILDTSFGQGQPYDIPITDVVPQEGAETYSTNNWFRGGTWYSKQEFIMLLRTDLPALHLSVDVTNTAILNINTTDPFVVSSMSTQDGDFTYEAGTRLSVGKILGRDVANRDHSLEFTFLGLFDWTGRASIEPANPQGGSGIVSLLGSNEVFSIQSGITGGFPVINSVSGFTNALNQNMLYQADFNSFELNYVIGGRPARDRLVMQPDGRWTRFATPSKVRGFYAGIRYIRQNEMFRFQSRGNNQIVSVFEEDANGNIVFRDAIGNIVSEEDGSPTVDSQRVGNIDEGGTYRVNTDNDLFGFQFGGDMVAKRTDWAFGVNGKVGGLLNFADRHSDLRTRIEGDRIVTNDPETDAVFETSTLSESLDDETLTFLSEINVYLSYYLKPNTSVRLGYNILYMNGLATATNNAGLQGGIFPKFELTGDSLYHGMNVGFETTW